MYSPLCQKHSTTKEFVTHIMFLLTKVEILDNNKTTTIITGLKVKSYGFKKALVESCQDLARCCKHLNFGSNWTQGVKAKHCWVLSTNFLFSVQYKTDTKQNMGFSVALQNGAKIQISLHYRILTRFHQGLFKSFGL